MDQNDCILITGADGLIGQALASWLLDKGCRVHALSRRREKLKERRVAKSGLHYFYWNVEESYLDPESLQGVKAIVHLAGESIGGGRWTAKRKRAILDSRVDSINLIFDVLARQERYEVKTVVSASATGIYEPQADHTLVEDSPVSDGFLGQTCLAWERAVEEGSYRVGARSVMLRSGVVLAREGGMYAQLRAMTRKAPAVIPGTGRQWLPWIHIRDAVRAYTHALEHDAMEGAYNMVAPESVTMGQFIKELAQGLDKRAWLPPVPAFLIKTGMGEMSALVLDSMKVSPSRLLLSGFEFVHPDLTDAMRQLEDPENQD